MKYFEEYLRKEMLEGKIDFSIRARVRNDIQGYEDVGIVEFYIHPSGKEGMTRDYVVVGDEVDCKN